MCLHTNIYIWDVGYASHLHTQTMLFVQCNEGRCQMQGQNVQNFPNFWCNHDFRQCTLLSDCTLVYGFLSRCNSKPQVKHKNMFLALVLREQEPSFSLWTLTAIITKREAFGDSSHIATKGCIRHQPLNPKCFSPTLLSPSEDMLVEFQELLRQNSDVLFGFFWLAHYGITTASYNRAFLLLARSYK